MSVKCACCNKSKNSLSPKNSELLNGVTLLMCETCIQSKYEPRSIIVIAARSNGPEYVRDFIVKRRYLGNDILAVELQV
jgi:hypothetical protein